MLLSPLVVMDNFLGYNRFEKEKYMNRKILKVASAAEIVLAIIMLITDLYLVGKFREASLLITPHDMAAKAISICIFAFAAIRLLFGIAGLVISRGNGFVVIGGFLMIIASLPVVGTVAPSALLSVLAALVSLIYLICAFRLD